MSTESTGPVEPAAGWPRELDPVAQASRLKKLNLARLILVAVGVFVTAFYGYELANVREAVRRAAEKEVRERQGVMDLVAFQRGQDERVRVAIVIDSAAVALGVLLIMLGIVMQIMPVIAAISGLLLLLAYASLPLFLGRPESVTQDVVIKIVVVVALLLALQTGVTYQRGEREADRLRQMQAWLSAVAREPQSPPAEE